MTNIQQFKQPLTQIGRIPLVAFLILMQPSLESVQAVGSSRFIHPDTSLDRQLWQQMEWIAPIPATIGTNDISHLVVNSNGFQKSDLSNKLKISDELYRKIDRELEPGELIKWVDQPVPRFFTAYSTLTFLFGIPWTAFAISWMWGALGFRWSRFDCFPLFGIPFVLIGFWMLSSPIQVWYEAHQTAYIITDKRAILIEGGITGTTIRSYLPSEFGDVHRRENNDGTGDAIIKIQLVTHSSTDADGYPSGETTREKKIGFMGIRNPKEVERMLKELAKIEV